MAVEDLDQARGRGRRDAQEPVDLLDQRRDVREMPGIENQEGAIAILGLADLDAEAAGVLDLPDQVQHLIEFRGAGMPATAERRGILQRADGLQRQPEQPVGGDAALDQRQHLVRRQRPQMMRRQWLQRPGPRRRRFRRRLRLRLLRLRLHLQGEPRRAPPPRARPRRAEVMALA